MLKEEKREKKQELIKVLGECVNTCNHCFSACLKEDDVKMMAKCIRLDKECAEVCSFTILVFHKSKFIDKYLELCASVCEACAEECGKYPNEHCKECAKACKECAEKCRGFRDMFKKEDAE